MKNRIFTIIVLAALFTLGSLSACKIGCKTGSGKAATEKRTVESFNKIEVSGGFKVVLTQDSSSVVTVTTDDNLLKYIRTSVSGGTLKIDTKKNLCGNGETIVSIGIKHLEMLKASGGIEISSAGRINTRDISFELSGATHLNLDLNAAKVRTKGSGSTEIELKGQATSHDLDLSGSGSIKALDFVVGTYDIETSGASECKINVLKELNIRTSGASDIQYRGNPANVRNDKSGASSVTKID